jgi:CheY-like chemotaxis protein
VIAVESALGKGSAFSFVLCLKKMEDPTEEPLEPGTIPDLTGKRLLIVEDVELNRLILRELLEETHAEMEEAEDGKCAAERFSESPEGYYDLIFMDVQMPNMNGYEATRRLRAMSRPDAATVPIIAMTANAYREDIERALDSGMNGHLSKPVDIDAVMQTLTDKLKA